MKHRFNFFPRANIIYVHFFQMMKKTRWDIHSVNCFVIQLSILQFSVCLWNRAWKIYIDETIRKEWKMLPIFDRNSSTFYDIPQKLFNIFCANLETNKQTNKEINTKTIWNSFQFDEFFSLLIVDSTRLDTRMNSNLLFNFSFVCLKHLLLFMLWRFNRLEKLLIHFLIVCFSRLFCRCRLSINACLFHDYSISLKFSISWSCIIQS